MITYTDLRREIDRGTHPERVRDFVLVVLAEITTGRQQIRAVRHPLGFTCLPVVRSGEEGVCVHIWPTGQPSPPPVTSAMHSHSWNLLSHVVHGRVRNQIIEVAENPDPAYRVYEVHSHGDIDEIRATPRLVRARGGMTQTRNPGESYRLPAGRFHLTEVDSRQGAVTVVLARTAPGRHDLSLGAINGRDHRIRRRCCDPAESVGVARWVTELLAGPAEDGGSHAI